jgi:hypothetical protein
MKMQCRGKLSKVALKYSALWVRDEVKNAMQAAAEGSSIENIQRFKAGGCKSAMQGRTVSGCIELFSV